MHRSRLLVVACFLTPHIADGQGTLKPPTALTVASATRSAVALSWTAGDGSSRFVIERKPLGTPWPAAPAARSADAVTTMTVDGAAATDSQIDVFATYVYRVRATDAPNSLSAPSNEVTVGPPPVGFSSIVAAPKAMQDYDPQQFASQLRMILDANGDPTIAYITYDLNSNGDADDSELAFIAWNRATYRWKAPVHVDDIGNVTRSGTRIALSLARDDSNGRLGILYGADDHDLRMAMSADSGATWTTVPVQHTPPEEGLLSTPSLALAAGRVHAAYYLGGSGVHYRTGGEDDAPDKWQDDKAPLLDGTFETRSEGVTVAIDGDGKPAVCYWLSPNEGYNSTMAFWRPGGAATKVTDTLNYQNDDPGAHMVISGRQVAIALYANRDEKFFDNHHLWFVRSNDAGATWSQALVVADDGGNSMGPPISVMVDRAGHPAMLAELSGGNSGGTQCGVPKLMRSDDGVKWTTCAPEMKGAPGGVQLTYPVGSFAGNDKLYVAFKTRAPVASLPAGLVLWRER